MRIKGIDKNEQMFYSVKRTLVLKEEIGMKRKEKVRFVVIVVLLTFAAFYFSAAIVLSRTYLSAQELEGYYQEQERVLVKETKAFLEEKGFRHSGVMLTRVVDGDGSREYTVTVHHGKIDRMGEDGRQQLMEELEKIVFEDGGCSFRHEFLINQ